MNTRWKPGRETIRISETAEIFMTEQTEGILTAKNANYAKGIQQTEFLTTNGPE